MHFSNDFSIQFRWDFFLNQLFHILKSLFNVMKKVTLLTGALEMQWAGRHMQHFCSTSVGISRQLPHRHHLGGDTEGPGVGAGVVGSGRVGNS